MCFAIEKDGIASVDFTVSLDWNVTTINMTQPCVDEPKFYRERDRIGSIFNTTLHFNRNSLEILHGSYSKKTMTKLKKVVNFLHERSMIDFQCHNEMVKVLEEMVEGVKKEYELETARFKTFLTDFRTNIVSCYDDLRQNGDLRFLSRNEISIDASLVDLRYLIQEVETYRYNPMKVGSRWVYLLLSEGALEHLFKSLNTQEYNELNERLVALNRGVSYFLQKYENEIHDIIEKTITDHADWFQQLYKGYKTMVLTGKSPSNRNFGPISNMDFGTLQLFLPSRFAISDETDSRIGI